MWEKVVLNLLSNALKFTFDGTISVSLRAEGADAVLRISDTGAGIAEAEMPRLFERFHRIPTAASRSNEGSGIGLALVRELVGLHGGAITAQSTQGSGTTFTVRLPFGHEHLPEENLAAAGPELISAAADPFLAEALRWLPGDQPDEPTLAAQVAGPPRRDLAGRGAPARVLLADDNADMRGYLQRLLQPGYEVTAVADGQEALDAVRAQPFDLVISDVMMPGLDGLRLVGELRAHSAPRTCRCCCCRPGPGRRRPSKAWKPGRTTTWLSRSPLRSCWRGSGRTWNWPGCVATTPDGAPR